MAPANLQAHARMRVIYHERNMGKGRRCGQASAKRPAITPIHMRISSTIPQIWRAHTKATETNADAIFGFCTLAGARFTSIARTISRGLTLLRIYCMVGD
jgi:hypothetical protein